MNQGRTIRLPVHINKELNQVIRARRRIEADHQGNCLTSEIASCLDKPIDEVRAILALDERAVSLDAPLDIDPTLSVGESLADETIKPPDIQIQNSEIENLLLCWIDTLTDKQRTIIRHRYGIDDCDVLTLESFPAGSASPVSGYARSRSKH